MAEPGRLTSPAAAHSLDVASAARMISVSCSVGSACALRPNLVGHISRRSPCTVNELLIFQTYYKFPPQHHTSHFLSPPALLLTEPRGNSQNCLYSPPLSSLLSVYPPQPHLQSPGSAPAPSPAFYNLRTLLLQLFPLFSIILCSPFPSSSLSWLLSLSSQRRGQVSLLVSPRTFRPELKPPPPTLIRC